MNRFTVSLLTPVPSLLLSAQAFAFHDMAEQDVLDKASARTRQAHAAAVEPPAPAATMAKDIAAASAPSAKARTGHP